MGTGIKYLTELHDPRATWTSIWTGTSRRPSAPTSIRARDARCSRSSTAHRVARRLHTLRAVKKTGQYLLLDRLDVTRTSLLEPGHRGGRPIGSDRSSASSWGVIRESWRRSRHDGKALLRGHRLRDQRTAPSTSSRSSWPGCRSARPRWTSTSAAITTTTSMRRTEDGDASLHLQWLRRGLDLRRRPGSGRRGDLSRRQAGTEDRHSRRCPGDRPRTVRGHGLRNGEHTIRVIKTSGEVLRHDVFRYQQK